MTTFQDDFDTLDIPPWVQVETVPGLAEVENGLLVNKNADGNYLVYTQDVDGGISVTVGNPTLINLSAPHGYAVLTQFAVGIRGETDAATGALINGDHVAIATTTTQFSIAVDTTALTPNDDGTVYFNKNTTSVSTPDNKQEALVAIDGNSASHFVLVWARMNQKGAPATALLNGYAAALTYASATSRTLSFLKVDTSTGALVQVGEALEVGDLTLKDGGEDLGVLQHLMFIVFDETKATDLPQNQGVVLRAYLNETDEGDPTYEVVDTGRSTTGVNLPVHRAAGTWAITLGKQDEVRVDAFVGIDDYVLPDFGVRGSEHSTQLELRQKVERILSIGGQTNYSTDLLNDAIDGSIVEITQRVGNKAFFLRKRKNVTLTADANTRLVTLPHDVGRLLHVWDGVSHYPVQADMIFQDQTQIQQVVYIQPPPSGKEYILEYVEKIIPLESDTSLSPIPKKYDELVAYGAAMRIAELHGERHMQQGIERRWSMRMNALLMEMSQIQRQKNPALRVHSRPRRNTRFGRLDVTGYNPFIA